MTTPHKRLFISCVTAEFGSYRDKLREKLTRPNVSVKVQEDFISTGTETLDMLDDYIQHCDAVIHLVGDMTGVLAKAPSVELIRKRYPDMSEKFPQLAPLLRPDALALSYTQWEAWLALYHGKRLIIAVPEEDAPRDERYDRIPKEHCAQQEHLQRLAEVERHPCRFADANGLLVEIFRSRLQEILAQTESPAREGQTVIRTSRIIIFGLALMCVGIITYFASVLGFLGNEIARFALTSLNLVLAVRFWFLIYRTPNLEFLGGFKSRLQYWAMLDVEVSGEGKRAQVTIDQKKYPAVRRSLRNERRVNALVKQFVNNIRHLVQIFILLYAAFFLHNPALVDWSGLTGIEDILNLWGAYFAALAFMVLYDQTLDEKEEDLAYYVPFLWMAGAGTLIYIGLFALPYMPNEAFERFKDPDFFRVVLNYVRLAIGSIAGLSFALLFGRYISMEHQLEKLAGTQYPKGMRLVFIIILPVYALVQPLFGNFHLKEFGDADMFANGIFLLCLLGKGFFFYVTWYFIKKKLMHYYLHLVLSTHGVPKNFDQCFKHTT